MCFNINLVCCRLPRILLEKPSMRLTSTSRTCSAPQLHCSSILCMILTERVLILYVAFHSVSVRVFQLLSLMVSGSTSQIMMHLPNSWSPVKGIPGFHLLSFLLFAKKNYDLYLGSDVCNWIRLLPSGMLMQCWRFHREPFSQCVAWTWHLIASWSDQPCILDSWVMASQLDAMMICGRDGVPRWSIYLPFLP